MSGSRPDSTDVSTPHSGRPTPADPVAGRSGGPSRRFVLGSLAATVSAAAAVPLLGAMPSAAAAPARRAAAPRSATRELVYFNTWKGTQIYGAWFDPGCGDLTPIGPVGDANADWAVTHPTLPILYVATMAVGGVVDTFRIDPASGALTKTGELSTGGTGLNGGGVSYIGIDQPSNTLLATNFEDGFTAAVPISRTGELAPPASLAQDTGSGPNPRQAGPHPHHAEVDPSGRFALVADFGADRVFVYRFDRETRTLSTGGPAGPYAYATAAGSGPRRVAFHPDGRTVYLLSELSSDLQTLQWNPASGELTQRQTVALDGPDFTGAKSASDLAISADGRFVYAGNRGENSLMVFAVAPRTDLLSTLQSVPCGGTTPWGFTVHPSGRWLLVANEASSTVNVFGIDQHSGRLTDTGTSLAVPNPDSITFFRP
ncbi:lactonase family protein [Streptomyces sp. NBC_00448]|uniref:lactonase family protein n=1 Tax=Streptomyces sp. NBC_00448 TaxID=2903652 RepID=UPI002E214ABE